MKKLKKITILLFLFFCLGSYSQTYFPLRNVETNLESFSGVNGQWISVFPSNSSLGANYYQGLNFGFDTNNYVSLVNGAGTNDLYFGRWDYGWKGWNRIWHSGNLNNSNTDFSAKILNSTGLDIKKSYDVNSIEALKIFYQGSWGTPQYASNYRFIDIQSTEEGNVLALNAYGMGIGYNPPSYASSDRLYINGNVGIGTTNPTAKLTVAGNINSREVKVTVDAGADFVFEKDYNLPSLESVDRFINENKHLPEIASANEMQKDGINLSEMNIKLLQKVEELTLYVIEMKKENLEMKAKQQQLENIVKKFKNKLR